MMQYFGLTGRKIKPDYVGIINAKSAFLPQKKAIADEEAYRAKTLDLESRRLDEESRLARESLEANKTASDRSSMIGLGQLGVSAYMGNKRDKQLEEIISGGGGTGKGSATPDFGGDVGDPNPMGLNKVESGTSVGSLSEKGGMWDGIKSGLKDNWGTMLSSSLVGGTVGAELGEKYVPIGGKAEKRIIGGAVTSGALSYLSSGDPYTAALSALFGGAAGGFL